MDRVLLVYGGSQGSLAINEAVADWIDHGLPSHLGMIWATGRATHAQFERLDGAADGRVIVRSYLSPISDAYEAADLALARAGAMTTAELFAWGIPAMLVPLPTAAADHQRKNAVALDAAGAAVHLRQDTLTAATLDAAVRRLLEQPEEMERLVKGAAARARPEAASTIARHMLEIAHASR